MIVFRLTQSDYANDLSGSGAEKYGGRWNSIGTPLIYTCESRALCALEIAVHTPLGNIPDDYNLVTIQIPDSPILTLKHSELSKGWDSIPYSNISKKFGDNLVTENKYLALKVPSAIIKDEHNILINPRHEKFNKVSIKNIESFSFDERLFKD